MADVLGSVFRFLAWMESFFGAQSSVLTMSFRRVEVIVELTLDSVHECAMMVLWVAFGDADDSDYFDGISPINALHEAGPFWMYVFV